MLRITLKGLLGHKLRFALTFLAIMFGVSFVVGSYVLAESVRAQFASLFSDINAGIDLQVRGTEQFDAGQFGGTTAAPVPEELLEEVQAVDGVSQAAGTIAGFKLVIGEDGEPVQTQGPPLGFNWSDAIELSTFTVVEGRGPESDDEMMLDVDGLERSGYAIGDTVPVSGPLGPEEYTLVGSIRFGESNALAGATLSVFTTAEAQRLFNLEGSFQTIEIGLAEGADKATVIGDIEEILPPDTEVVDQETVVQEGEESVGIFIDIFRNTLLGFAAVIFFVALFLIFNTFKIVVGQRVRELALLRAVGASGSQVFRSVIG